MNIKRILFLLLFVLAVIFGINLMGNHEKPELRGIHHLSIVPLGTDGYRYTGVIQIFNPSIFQLRLSAVNIQFELNNNTIGVLQNPLNLTISSKETGNFPFEIRFNKEDFNLEKQTTIMAHFKGDFSNASLLSKVNVQIDTTETVTIK